MTTTTLPFTRPPTTTELDRLAETVEERALDRLLVEALERLRSRRRARRARLRELVRDEHELRAQHALLHSGLLHLR